MNPQRLKNNIMKETKSINNKIRKPTFDIKLRNCQYQSDKEIT